MVRENPEVVQRLTQKLDAWKSSLPTVPSENGLSKSRAKVMAKKAQRTKKSKEANKAKKLKKQEKAKE